MFDSISEWTQKLIDFIDPIEIEVQSGDSDSVPVPEVNMFEVDASKIASESDQTSAEEKRSIAEPELARDLETRPLSEVPKKMFDHG